VLTAFVTGAAALVSGSCKGTIPPGPESGEAGGREIVTGSRPDGAGKVGKGRPGCGKTPCADGLERPGKRTTPDTARGPTTFTSPAVEVNRLAATAPTRTTARAGFTRVMMSAVRDCVRDGGSGTDCTPAAFAAPGQPLNATMAPTTANISRAAATSIAVVPRLEM
jgi:hypothetical protein